MKGTIEWLGSEAGANAGGIRDVGLVILGKRVCVATANEYLGIEAGYGVTLGHSDGKRIP